MRQVSGRGEEEGRRVCVVVARKFAHVAALPFFDVTRLLTDNRVAGLHATTHGTDSGHFFQGS